MLWVTPGRGVDLGLGCTAVGCLSAGCPLSKWTVKEEPGGTQLMDTGQVLPQEGVSALSCPQPCPNSQPGPAQPSNPPALKMLLICNLGKSTVDLPALFS